MMDPKLADPETLLKEACNLKPLPASVTRLAAVIARHDCQLTDVSAAIQFDEGLVVRTLGAANSAAHGGRRTIATVEEAVIRLGAGRVLALALGEAVGRDLLRALPAYGLAEGELWTHSVTCALAAECAPRYCRRSVRPEAFAAALLHDVGKVVISDHLCADSGGEGLGQRARDLGSEEGERGLLSIGHAEVSAGVAHHWELPETLALGIEHHHSPLAAPDEESRWLASQVHLADAVATALGHGSGETNVACFGAALAGGLELTQRGFDELCSDVDSRLEDVLALYS